MGSRICVGYQNKAAGAENSGLSRNTPPAGVLRTAQIASSHTPNRKPKSSHSANIARAALLITTFHGTKLVRGRSWRVGEMTGARDLESDMVVCGYEECGLGVGCKAHATGWVQWG
jgi:hypothetical protein